MIQNAVPADPHRPTLLAPDEPGPFRILNPRAVSPLILLCDHASRAVPRALGDLGLDPVALRCHLAWDIGAGALTERLAGELGATAVLAGYSRLVVDCNRQLLDPQAFLEYGDGLAIPGNRGLAASDREARAAAIYRPYHRAVAAELERLRAAGRAPVVLAIHSYAPVLNGAPREWEIGILWDKDPRVPDALIPALREQGFNVGDNEPYSGRGPQDFTIDHHAEAAGLPHAGIEVRQDLISDEQGIERLAALLAPLFEGLTARAEEAGRPSATA